MTHRKSSWQWWFYLGILPVSWGLCAWQGWQWWSWATAPAISNPATTEVEVQDAPPAQSIQIEIPVGTPSQQIGEDLQLAGLIRSTLAWRLWGSWLSVSRTEGGFQAGTYEISPNASLPEIANRIWRGEVLQRSFTVPEGRSRQQMAAAFEAMGLFDAEAFLAATEQIPRDRYPWLPEDIPHLEGFLFPDTYSLPAEQVSPEAIVDVMLVRFEQVALPIYQKRGSSKGTQVQSPAANNLTLLAWVTLASIVEKEAVQPQERRLIAGVFTQRLRRNMNLGADPTVEYGLGVTQTPDRPLTLAQVNTPSPYNTYLNPGLPPTPIASPGRASLEAALNPQETEYLYFVARYDGTHIFSRTLAEHEAAIAQVEAALEKQAN